MKFKVNMNADVCGTCLQGYVSASFASLREKFGEPSGSDGCKVSTEWSFESSTGQVVTLYDYKETALYDDSNPSVEDFRSLESYAWHIGARSKADADAFTAWLKGVLL